MLLYSTYLAPQGIEGFYPWVFPTGSPYPSSGTADAASEACWKDPLGSATSLYALGQTCSLPYFQPHLPSHVAWQSRPMLRAVSSNRVGIQASQAGSGLLSWPLRSLDSRSSNVGRRSRYLQCQKTQRLLHGLRMAQNMNRELAKGWIPLLQFGLEILHHPMYGDHQDIHWL